MINAPGYSVADAWQVQVQAQIQMKAKVLVKNGFMSDAEIRAAHFEPVADVRRGVSRRARNPPVPRRRYASCPRVRRRFPT